VKFLPALKAKGKPFCLAVGFLKPHLPFVAPKKYWDLYNPDQIPLPAIDHLPIGAPEFAGHDNGELHSYANVPKGNPIPADFAKTLRHGYYACISYTDAQVGRLLDALDREGLTDNTVIVFWGDHGWQLGDHGLWHKHTNFELAARVPLLISVPGQKTAGQKCNAPVEFLDVYPTLADVCGLPIPSGLDGASLKPLLENPAASVKKVAISQYPRGGRQAGNRSLMGYSIRDERWRLTLWRDRNNFEIAATELYDEANDPAESVNLADKPEHKAVVAALSKYLPPRLELPPNSGKASSKGKVAAASAKPKVDRVALFEKKDKNQDGKLSQEEFLASQPDPEEAPKRFPNFDTNKDGFLSREEFINGGKTAPTAP
jgi:iduronate 2-sulfatase